MPIITTPILDDFGRPDTTSIYGNVWKDAFTSAHTAHFGITGFKAYAVDATTGPRSLGYWVSYPSITDFQVYATLTDVSSTFSPGVAARISIGASPTCYFAFWDASNTRWAVRMGTPGSEITISNTSAFAPSNGDKIVFQGKGNILSLWKVSSGVETLISEVVNSTYTTGYIGMYGLASSGAPSAILDDFGGGSLVNSNIPGPIAGRGATW